MAHGMQQDFYLVANTLRIVIILLVISSPALNCLSLMVVAAGEIIRSIPVSVQTASSYMDSLPGADCGLLKNTMSPGIMSLIMTSPVTASCERVTA